MQVVITGASGFLGSAIAKKLLNASIKPLQVSRQNAVNFFRVSTYADTPSGDVLIHLAENNNRTQVNQLSTNYECEALNILDALLEKKYKKVIYASSSVLYGDEVCVPHIESDHIKVDDAYSRVKLASEQRVLSSGGIVVRLANLYGVGMARENVLSHILSQLDQPGPIRLHSTSPIRDFIWAEDAAEAIVRMVFRDIQGLYNVGTGIGTSIEMLARIALKEAQQTTREIISLQQSVQSSCIILDITKAKYALDWNPSIRLDEGLRRLIHQ